MTPNVEQGLKRLMLFRVVIITTLLLIAISVEAVSETLLRVNPLYFLIAGTYALTLVYALALRFIPYTRAQVYVQVILDLAVVTGLVYLTGGASGGTRAGFILLYPISVLSGSLLLPRSGGLSLAAAATVMYAAALGAVRTGRVPVQGLYDVPFMPIQQLSYLVFVAGVACATVALIGSYLSESLHSAGARLEEAVEQVADLRSLNEVIVNSIQSGLATADDAGRILHVNTFGEGILGLRNPEVRGRTLREVFNSDLLEPSTLRVRAVNRGLARLEVVYRHPGGDMVDLGVSISKLETADPGGGGFLLVFQNLTDVKRLEHEVRVKEKLAAVGEMAAQLAHEIRNPLGSISGSAQVLMGEPNMSAEQEQLLAIITRESRRLSDALNQFLFQARPPSARPGPVDLGPVIAEAVTLLRNAPEVGPRHRVAFEADEGPHVCMADRDRMLQVFWNLARNGLEAMPEGGLLELRLSRREHEVVLSVEDEGRGIAREDQLRVFEPFHSGAGRMGTGLGLAIVYRIVQEHRGDIRVRSTRGKGTAVEVHLPLVAVPVSA
jgi:two-component system sensor histidine kinase PilS (NtrC family)